MQLVGKSWATAMVEGKDPLSALNAALKTYRNTEHSVTGRKPAEWLFGRAIRTRLPDSRWLQTQHDDEETTKAKQKMVERGQREKERRDKHAREEELSIGMKVLLKNKTKRKGQPKYDPKPYTITDLKGRQATLERGERKIRRETQKFKRFFEPAKPVAEAEKKQPDNDWEDSRRTGNSTKQLRGANKNARTTPDNANEPTTTGNLADNDTTPQTSSRDIAPETNNIDPVTDNKDPEVDSTIPETDNTHETEQTAQQATENQHHATDGRRTSHRERRPRDMYGDWDTSKCREYTRH